MRDRTNIGKQCVSNNEYNVNHRCKTCSLGTYSIERHSTSC